MKDILSGLLVLGVGVAGVLILLTRLLVDPLTFLAGVAMGILGTVITVYLLLINADWGR